jgi:alkanesulfonate monooxygenase SsuD/methylene tetrahydromethanopterin reductase-like flavin-dependent oxidoreductase (luciferase family)
MQIGTGLFSGQRPPWDDRDMGEIYDEMVELVQHAEDVGLDSAWTSEHHFAEDAYLPGVTSVLAGCATVTEEIELGTSMLLAPLHNPVRIAEEAATVSLLSGGRFTLGLTNGYRDMEFENFGVRKRERAARTEEAVKIARRAWSPGPLDYEPMFADVSADVSVTPKPDDSPTITMGGTAKAAVRRAAMLGDGWTAPEMVPLDGIHKRKRYIERLRDVEKRSDDFTVYVQRYCFVDDSAEAAWETIEDSLLYVQETYNEWWEGEEVTLSAEERENIKDATVFGTPAEVAEEVAEYQEVLGDDVHVILRAYHPGVDTEDMRRCFELIGDEVAPQFQ